MRTRDIHPPAVAQHELAYLLTGSPVAEPQVHQGLIELQLTPPLGLIPHHPFVKNWELGTSSAPEMDDPQNHRPRFIPATTTVFPMHSSQVNLKPVSETTVCLQLFGDWTGLVDNGR